MKHQRKWNFILILSIIILVSACKTLEISPTVEPTPAKELKHLGYTIQVGAFSIVDNAIRLTQSLNKKGLKAYYFAHPSGLYKVRFGDFSSRKSAEKKAKSLIKAGTIEEYYIVAPEEYAVAKRKKYGKQYLRDEIVSTARRFIGTPYAWGGSSQSEGFDCSGLTMTVYKLNGLNLPHSSRQQYKIGTPVRKSNLKKGDLVFFATSRGKKVSHVGIYTGNNQFIHAPSFNKRVRIDSLSNTYFREKYVGARTYLK